MSPMSVIIDRTRRQEVLLPIYRKTYSFRENKNSQIMKEGGNLYLKADQGGVNCLMSLYTLFLQRLKPRLCLVDLNYNIECDWLVELPIKTWQVASGK